jgi:hypothetical protein
MEQEFASGDENGQDVQVHQHSNRKLLPVLRRFQLHE